ncbi:TetR/AcrR family transcriptional regulator [Nocardioides sp. JQ2195]|uniref:TetR/AcrR family transcriptional regulator n=1 Tax=Nocardioides sp. JQ2195 TaxID=2592334 RepID=UPI00143EE1CA|nr:TetR/AcrR family transcriptional regulator [Nocardioides sp. JQ2195]QIX26119.1 TetR/AcrR family transcriptional regulator [Nocardioides sp. JQ2195]
MPRLIDSINRTDTLTLAINHVIATDGVPGLTLRRISQVSGVRAPTVVNHFGSRARLLHVAAVRNAKDRLDEFVVGQPYRGLRALLPKPSDRSWCTDATVHARVWLGWLELWRSDPDLERCLNDHHAVLRQYLHALTEGRIQPRMLTGLLALSEGLQSQMAAPVRPLSPADAEELFLRTLSALDICPAPVRQPDPVPAHLDAALSWMRHAGRGGDWRADPDLAAAFRTDAVRGDDGPGSR